VAITERDWRLKIDAARHEDDVLAIARAYLDGLAPHEVESLPDGVRPAHLVDAHDLATCAYNLVAAHCRSANEPDDGGFLYRVATFFAHAQARIAFLATPAARQRAYITTFDLNHD
jgi:hypothetical protein